MTESNIHNERMKIIMFYVFLILFVITVLGTLGMVFLGFGTPTEDERSLLVNAFIVEIGAAITALFYSLFSLKSKKNKNNSEEVISLQSKINELETKLKEYSKTKTSQDGTKKDEEQIKLKKRIVALFGGGEEMNVPDILKSLYHNDYDNDQKDCVLEVIGELVLESVLEPATNRYSGYRLTKNT